MILCASQADAEWGRDEDATQLVPSAQHPNEISLTTGIVLSASNEDERRWAQPYVVWACINLNKLLMTLAAKGCEEDSD